MRYEIWEVDTFYKPDFGIPNGVKVVQHLKSIGSVEISDSDFLKDESVLDALIAMGYVYIKSIAKNIKILRGETKKSTTSLVEAGTNILICDLTPHNR